MRVRIILLPLVLLLSACASEPEAVARDFTQAVSDGDTAAALERIDPEIRKNAGGKLTFVIQTASRAVDARGGVKSIKTESVGEQGDRARVRMVTTYHDGSVEAKVVTLRRIGGKWYLSN